MSLEETKRASEIIALEKLYSEADTKTAMKEAVRVFNKYKSGAALNILALCHKKLGQYQKAQGLFEKALSQNPANTLFLGNLGNVYTDLGRWQDALNCFKKCLLVDPTHSNVLISLGNQYAAKSNYEPALMTFKRFLAVDNSANEKVRGGLNYKLAEIYRKKGAHFSNQAIHHYKLSNEPLSNAHYLELVYKFHSESLYYEAEKKIIAAGDVNPLIGAIQNHASIRYGKKNTNAFCIDPFKYIYHSQLSKENGFTETLRENLIKIKTQLDTVPQELIQNGQQTAGNFLLLDHADVAIIRKIISQQVNEYYSRHVSSEEGFIKYWPKESSLHGWIINLRTGGSLGSHMHKLGWISGSLYLKIERSHHSNEGNIVFELHGADYPTNSQKFPSKEIHIKTGDIVLFPSSIFHRTVPFKTKEDRVTLAFDVKPIY